MGQKGAKLSAQATDVAETLVERMSSLGEISCRKMFGGYGVFAGRKMFALVNSEAGVFFKVDDSNRQRFDEVHAEQHGKMPYYAVPKSVFQDKAILCEWAQDSIAVALKTKK